MFKLESQDVAGDGFHFHHQTQVIEKVPFLSPDPHLHESQCQAAAKPSALQKLQIQETILHELLTSF